MLIKQVKYDLYYNWKLFVGVMAALLCWGAVGAPYRYNQVAVTLNLVLLPVLLACAVMCVVSVLRYYSRAMYGRQGYLNMTLPTSPANLLGAKVITTAIWFNVILAVALFAVGLYTHELGSMLKDIVKNFGDMFAEWFELNLNMLSTLLALYLAITVANVSVNGRRLGALGGIGAYIVWSILQNVVQRIMSSALSGYPLRGSMSSVIFGVLTLSGWAAYIPQVWAVYLYYIAFATAAFFLNCWLIKKKVSLQ